MSFNPSYLPTINAVLNTLASILLIMGWRAIKRGKKEVHQKYMVSAFITSSLFLCSYLMYHILKPGVTKYEHEGVLRVIYFSILLTHTPLAALIVPLALSALWFAYKQNFTRHVKVTRILLPLWLYVSVTGVIIYCMLYIF